MKTFDVLCDPLEDASGWEMEICHDLSGNKLSPSASRRRMIYQILKVCEIDIDEEVFELLSEYSIDQLLLDNGINVVFHDSME